MFKSRFMPCPDCGGSVDQTVDAAHVCLPERRAEFQVFRLRDDVDAIEDQVHSYLGTPSGRFEVWLAARHVRGQS